MRSRLTIVDMHTHTPQGATHPGRQAARPTSCKHCRELTGSLHTWMGEKEVGHHPAGSAQYTTVLHSIRRAFAVQLSCACQQARAATTTQAACSLTYGSLVHHVTGPPGTGACTQPSNTPAHQAPTMQHHNTPAFVNSPQLRRSPERPVDTPAGGGHTPITHTRWGTHRHLAVCHGHYTAYPPKEAGMCLCTRHCCAHDIGHGAATVTTDEDKVKVYTHHMQQVEHSPAHTAVQMHVVRQPACSCCPAPTAATRLCAVNSAQQSSSQTMQDR